MIGAPYDDDAPFCTPCENAGSAHVFRIPTASPTVDCNSNGIPDECDSDWDGDGIPDECDVCPVDNPDDTDLDGVCDSGDNCPTHFNPDQDSISSPPEAEMIGTEVSTKNRFLSFAAGASGRNQAVRVTVVSLPPPFDVWDSTELWVGPPRAVSENGAIVDPNDPSVPPGTPTFQAAMLECTRTPHCMDWSSLGTVHVFHEAVVPSKLAASTGPIEIPAVYDIQVVDCACDLPGKYLLGRTDDDHGRVR